MNPITFGRTTVDLDLVLSMQPDEDGNDIVVTFAFLAQYEPGSHHAPHLLFLTGQDADACREWQRKHAPCPNCGLPGACAGPEDDEDDDEPDGDGEGEPVPAGTMRFN